jgi:hypothetical protein
MGSAVSGGLGIMSKVMEYNSQMDEANSKSKAAIQSENMKFQNYEVERQDAFDSTVNQLTNIEIKSNNQVGAVNAALGESSGGGNTAKLLTRSVAAQGARDEGSTKEAYQSKSNEIDLNKESTALSTTSYLNSIKRPSATATLVGIASTAYSTYQGGLNQQAEDTTKGVSFSWSNYLWKGEGSTLTNNSNGKG